MVMQPHSIMIIIIGAGVGLVLLHTPPTAAQFHPISSSSQHVRFVVCWEMKQKCLRTLCALLTIFGIVLILSASRRGHPVNQEPSAAVIRLPVRDDHPHSSISNNPLIGDANFTLVIQTYQRNDLLHRLLTHYCKYEAVDRIIVVWNNMNETVPDFLHYIPCGPQLFYLEQVENTIRNRFQPFSQIRTEGGWSEFLSLSLSLLSLSLSDSVCVCVCLCMCVRQAFVEEQHGVWDCSDNCISVDIT